MKKLIFGISGVGKSTYIEKILAENMLDQATVLMGYMFKNIDLASLELPVSYVVHYNLRRCFKRVRPLFEIEPLIDSTYKFLLNNATESEIHVLVSPPRVIKHRLLTRKFLEPHALVGNNMGKILELFEETCLVNLVDLYLAAIKPFEENGYSIKYISSGSNFEFFFIDKYQALQILADEVAVSYSQAEKESISFALRENYQSFDEGVSSNGKFDRMKSFELISKYLIGAESLLDIGCAEGFFCFKAEELGVKSILGTEIRTNRFVTANIYKEIRGSKVYFKNIDVFSQPLISKFQVVLLLNVLHHLANPFEALKIVTDLCTETLILEFPSLGDTKFSSSSLPNPSCDLDTLPLIGISAKSKNDQTFLFSPEALKIFLTEHLSAYKSIEIIPSPFAQRYKWEIMVH